MNLHTYSAALGAILINLQSLEYGLRVFLHNHNGEGDIQFEKIKAGESFPEASFTNWDSLGKFLLANTQEGVSKWVGVLWNSLRRDIELLALLDKIPDPADRIPSLDQYLRTRANDSAAPPANTAPAADVETRSATDDESRVMSDSDAFRLHCDCGPQLPDDPRADRLPTWTATQAPPPSFCAEAQANNSTSPPAPPPQHCCCDAHRGSGRGRGADVTQAVPRRHPRRRTRGYRLQPGAVYVGQPTGWGSAASGRTTGEHVCRKRHGRGFTYTLMGTGSRRRSQAA